MNAGLRFSAMASWNAVVDVSNVCWSPYLPPLGRQAPVWDRLSLVMSAWRDQHGADALLELVADDSLVRVLGPDARAFLALKRDGGIRTASVADDEILDALGKTEVELTYLLRAAVQQTGGTL